MAEQQEMPGQQALSRLAQPPPELSPGETKQEQHVATEESDSAEQASQLSPPAQEEVLRPPKPDVSKRELREAIKGSGQVLASAATFALFPDTLTLDRAKVTATKRTFFRTAEVMSMRIEDILNVTASIGPIFGSVKIVSRVLNSEKPYNVGVFWRPDAVRMKRVIQGYIIALQRKIDCSSLSTAELTGMLDKLGEDDHVV